MRQAILIAMLAAAPVAAETKIYQAKHRPAASLQGVLGNMQGSLLVNYSRDFNTVALNGSAETIKVAEALLEKYDTPRRQAEFLLRVIEAGSGVAVDKGLSDAAELVPAELKSMLKYSRYSLLDSAILRGMEAEELRLAMGNNLNGRLRFNFRDSTLEIWVDITGPPTNIKNSQGNDTTHWPSILQTTATAKSGETVVLGASKMRGGNNALIMLVTTKLLP